MCKVATRLVNDTFEEAYDNNMNKVSPMIMQRVIHTRTLHLCEWVRMRNCIHVLGGDGTTSLEQKEDEAHGVDMRGSPPSDRQELEHTEVEEEGNICLGPPFWISIGRWRGWHWHWVMYRLMNNKKEFRVLVLF